MFGIVKFEHLILKRNPNLTTNKEGLEDWEVYDTTSDEFMMAFAITSNGSINKSAYNPRYFRWILIDSSRLNNEASIVSFNYEMQPCTDE